MYNKADDEWDWDFYERASLVMGSGAYNYDSYEQNNLIDEYSDLSYEQYEFTLGATYNFTEAFYTKISGTYDIFESDEMYVYGDEDGDSYAGYVAVGYSF